MTSIRYRDTLLKFSVIINLFLDQLWSVDFCFKVYHLFFRLQRIDEIDADFEHGDQRSYNHSIAVDTRTCPRLDCGRVEVRRSMPQNRQLVLQGDASIVNEVPALQDTITKSCSLDLHFKVFRAHPVTPQRDVFALLWCDAFIIALPDCDPSNLGKVLEITLDISRVLFFSKQIIAVIYIWHFGFLRSSYFHKAKSFINVDYYNNAMIVVGVIFAKFQLSINLLKCWRFCKIIFHRFT